MREYRGIDEEGKMLDRGCDGIFLIKSLYLDYYREGVIFGSDRGRKVILFRVPKTRPWYKGPGR